MVSNFARRIAGAIQRLNIFDSVEQSGVGADPHRVREAMDLEPALVAGLGGEQLLLDARREHLGATTRHRYHTGGF